MKLFLWEKFLSWVHITQRVNFTHNTLHASGGLSWCLLGLYRSIFKINILLWKVYFQNYPNVVKQLETLQYFYVRICVLDQRVISTLISLWYHIWWWNYCWNNSLIWNTKFHTFKRISFPVFFLLKFSIFENIPFKVKCWF